MLGVGGVVSRGRLADEISDRLAGALMTGEIAEGEYLPSEAEISERFGVSKPIAREALRILAAAGLVQTQHGKLSRARGLNGESINRIFGWAIRANPERLVEANQLRLAVEAGVVRIAAEERASVGIDKLNNAFKQMCSFSKDNPSTFVDADVAFHQAIALCTGNRLICVQVEGLEVVQRGVSTVFSNRSRSSKDWKETLLRHEQIAEAIINGHPDEAELAVRNHFAAADVAALQLSSIQLGSNS